MRMGHVADVKHQKPHPKLHHTQSCTRKVIVTVSRWFDPPDELVGACAPIRQCSLHEAAHQLPDDGRLLTSYAIKQVADRRKRKLPGLWRLAPHFRLCSHAPDAGAVPRRLRQHVRY